MFVQINIWWSKYAKKLQNLGYQFVQLEKRKNYLMNFLLAIEYLLSMFKKCLMGKLCLEWEIHQKILEQ